MMGARLGFVIGSSFCDTVRPIRRFPLVAQIPPGSVSVKRAASLQLLPPASLLFPAPSCHCAVGGGKKVASEKHGFECLLSFA